MKPVTASHAAYDPHLQQPHHDYPFSPAEAAKKQAEAMESARAQALAQLQAVGGPQPASVQGGMKGPRGTYDTSTSGPSFRHLLQQDGMPTSRHISIQPAIIQQQGGDSSNELARMNQDSFFRIPFGVPMGLQLPRPMMAMRTGTGAGMAIGVGSGTGRGFYGVSTEPGLSGVQKSPESAHRRTDRSAFVESVDDVSLEQIDFPELMAVFSLRRRHCMRRQQLPRESMLRRSLQGRNQAHA